MNHRQTRIERAAEGSFPYWVCLIEEKCTGSNYEKVQEFCRANGLRLSRHSHSVVWQKEWYQVFRFAEQAHAERFMQEFGGEPMHPSERGKGKNWAQWKKGRIGRSRETLTTFQRIEQAGGQRSRQWPRISSCYLKLPAP